MNRKFKDPYEMEAISFVPGVILRVTSVETYISRNLLRKFFDQFGKVNYVDHSIGQSTAHIRFSRSSEANLCIEELQKRETHIGNNRLKCVILEGGEEEAYWKKIRTFSSAIGGSFPGPKRKRKKQRTENRDDDICEDRTPEQTNEVNRRKTDEVKKNTKISKKFAQRTHIIFSNSDEESEEKQEISKNQSSE